jgi:hypothetical protein
MSVRFRFDLQACDGPTPLVSVQFGGAQPMEVGLVMNGVAVVLRIRDATGGTLDRDLDPAVLSQAEPWSEWLLVIDILAPYVDVHIDGSSALQVTDLVAANVAPDPPSLHFGVLGGSSGFGCGVWFDDIVVF